MARDVFKREAVSKGERKKAADGELAAEAARLERLGVDEVTIMDSAGTMRPGAVKEYTAALKQAVQIPVGFHGHNNLGFLEQELIPRMEQYGYHAPIKPLDLALGYADCHSSFLERFKRATAETGTDLFRLICKVSGENQKNPDDELIQRIAKAIKRRG